MTRRHALALLAGSPAFAAGKHSFAIEGDRFLLDRRPFVIRSGEMHYARIPREYWRDRMKKVRALGLNTLCMYSFWNMHEPRPGRYDFSGNLDIAEFIRTAQEEGLWVLVRPGPYSCAEWEFGGFPYWLLRTRDMKVRTADPRFLDAARAYMKALLSHVAPLQITHGGPVLMVQVENEYGSFGKDKKYLNAIRSMIVDSGIDVPLYTADGSEPAMLAGGTLPGVASVINFGGAPQQEFANFARFRRNVPLMCGEYWVGWFDHWGEKHHTGDNAVHLAGIDWMLQRNISFNLYMVHGGTNWGFMNGANYGTVSKFYEPTISSYDYDSPIDEAGRPAPKFALFRDVIRKHLAPGETLPGLPPPLPVIEIPRFDVSETAPLFALLGDPVRSARPLTFEELDQAYGFVLYRTRPNDSAGGKLEIVEPRDFALVFQDGRRVAAIDRRLGETSASVSLAAGRPLDILVENMGRINFGPRLLDDRKGITDKVMLDGVELAGWEMFRLPCDNLQALRFSNAPAHGPSFFRATFTVPATGDTFLDMRGWGKGNVWVNGRNLGRYWKIGPQQTLFCPGVWLKKGKNEIIVLDLFDGAKVRSVAGLRNHVWNPS
ncbi:MAG TPA: beta-galactosidase family protein [Bryobacteraceae bacterium]|nr:beta-galactosidase family protein [Bryobacteraceae bacterium]